ncbi:reticulocyte binding protein 2b (RBP2b) [Plasmodium ovale wallikeri]|uniref:Reticulocyte binding protein 2b (RBP2b) n=1 Tax=Plasmodium ovale wallikeri TaxID=864142 RepID=A0A1A9AI11_PLAOA|nr:reticulocyte binding protein 2b (RBP2b) [Plasmodium ovale wallikeri]SBT56235.1 reticulocyte binding protein 2b (RBP2b) [Plasmodium ovale wallikeri]
MTQRVNKFLWTSYENDNDEYYEKNSYNEFLKNRDNIINKGNSISNDIHSFKEKIKDTDHKLLSHHDTEDIFKTHTNKKYSDIINNSSVEELKSKKNSLTEKVKKHIGEINDDKLIGQDVQKMLKNALDKEMSDISNKFPDDSIN